jgi:hypothetical protein
MAPRRWLAFGFGLLTLAAACLPSLEDMTPFPCADDGSCPRGLSCTPTVGCVRATLDSPCVVGATNCAGAGEGASCALGLCTIGCDERRTCPTAHVCSAPSAAGAGVCVPDCAANQACPPGLTCRPLGFETAKGCLGSGGGASLDAPCERQEDCSSAGSNATCSLGLCATPCGPTLPCAAGHLCSAFQSRKDGACLPDCTGSGSCPQGLQCKAIGYEGKRACVGADASNVTCSDHLDTDDGNCGSCGVACGVHGRCVTGGCVCGEGALKCGETCVDPRTDAKNCSACGHDCFQGACAAGKCQPGTVIEQVPTSGTLGALLQSVDGSKLYLGHGIGTFGAWDSYDAYSVPIGGGAASKVASLGSPRAYPDGYIGGNTVAMPDGLYVDVFENISGVEHHTIRRQPYGGGATAILFDLITPRENGDGYWGFGVTGGALFARGYINVNYSANGSILGRVNPSAPYGLSMQPMNFTAPTVDKFGYDGERFLYVLGFSATDHKIVRVDATRDELLEGCPHCPPPPRWAGRLIQTGTSPVVSGSEIPPDSAVRGLVVDRNGLAYAIGPKLRYLKHGAPLPPVELASGPLDVVPVALDGMNVYYEVSGTSPLYLDHAIWRIPNVGGTPEQIVNLPPPTTIQRVVVGPDSIFYQVEGKIFRVAK